VRDYGLDSVRKTEKLDRSKPNGNGSYLVKMFKPFLKQNRQSFCGNWLFTDNQIMRCHMPYHGKSWKAGWWSETW